MQCTLVQSIQPEGGLVRFLIETNPQNVLRNCVCVCVCGLVRTNFCDQYEDNHQYGT